MPAGPRLGVNDLAKVRNRTARDIRELAREAMDAPDMVDWPVLRDRTTGEPITDKDGLAYAVVDAPPARRGRPALSRGEVEWTLRPVKPPPRVTLAQRYLLHGSSLGRKLEIINAIAAAAGIIPGSPVRALGCDSPGEAKQVISADRPGPVLGMLLRPECRPMDWRTGLGDHVEVLVRGTLLLPAAGPVGMCPGSNRLLWDPESLCWRGEPVEGRRMLELLGSWGLDHSSDGTEPPAAFIDSDQGLRLEWVHHPES